MYFYVNMILFYNDTFDMLSDEAIFEIIEFKLTSLLVSNS